MAEAVDMRSAALLQHALAYAKRGWHVFPIYEITASGHCSCNAGSRCGSPGKHPRTPNGFKAATLDPSQIRDWWKRWPNSNVAIATGPSRLVVVDVDPRNQGDESLAALEKQHGQLPNTVRALTGGGGNHEIFAMPEAEEVKSGVLALGVEIKAAGGYIVAAPSNHISGGKYEWDSGGHPRETDLRPIPEWILSRLGSKDSKQYELTEDVRAGFLGACFDAMGHLGRPVGVGKVTVECPWESDHTSGSRHDSSTIVFAPTKGHRVGWFWCSHAHCAKGRTMADVLRAIPEEAKNRAREKLKLDPNYSPEAERKREETPKQFEQSDDAKDDWARGLRFNGEGKLTKDPGNAALILANLDAWKGCLQYDAFADRIRWARPAPPIPGLDPPKPGADLADHHVVYVSHWLAKMRFVTFPKTCVQDALESAAKANSVHPVRDYLNGLTWDGTPRVPTWLQRYLGGPDTAYAHAVGRFWMISAVARIMENESQADHLVVLEGGQGAGKSTAARILGGEWFLASLPDIQSKDAAQLLQGHWIVEIGELDAFRGAAGTRVKDWVTRTVDSYRPAYGRFTVRRPRQVVFLGTTNESHYLTDATGARRFWPVRVSRLDREALVHDRDQLWAEAKRYYDSGEPWHPGEELAKDIAEAQEERHAVDEWEQRISEWAVDRNGFQAGEVLGGPIGLDPGKWDRSAQTRVGMCLRRLGFSRRDHMEKSQKVRRYWRAEQ